MVIQNILTLDRVEQAKPRLSKEKLKAEVETTHAVPADSFISGNPAQDSADRTELLASVRKKLHKGFYNSEAVLEDLSDAFAGVFNKLL
jgi:hypothetical protein